MKKHVGKVLVSAFAMTVALAGAAAVNPAAAEAKVTVKKVAVEAPSGSTAYVAKGKKVKLTADVTVKPDKSANKKVTYTSANKRIASVTAKGEVKGVKPGKTKITVASKKNKKKKKTIKVVVMKKAVTKVQLNKTSATLAIGGSQTLKATVKPAKNVSKVVEWKTSNKKAATVSSKGVVKGVGEGTATITGTSTDGSNKKATCKVTVGAGIASVSVPHNRVVRVTLTSAKALTADKFDVRNKDTKDGKYNDATKCVVESVKTTDNKTYDVILASGFYVYSDSFLKVTISTLAANKEKEIYVSNIAGYGNSGNNENVKVTSYAVGEKYEEHWYVSNSNTVGRVSYSVSGLPDGLKAYVNENKDDVYVTGVFKSVQNGTTATITGVDEAGKTFTKKYKFFVGDEKTIVYSVDTIEALSYVPDDPKTVAKDEENGTRFSSTYLNLVNQGDGYEYMSYSDYVHASGGKNGDVEISYDLSGIKTYDDEGNRLAIPAGTYNIKVTVTAESNEELKKEFNLPVKLVQGVTVSGTVKDAAGNAAPYVGVRGYTRSDENGRYKAIYAESESDGKYSARVLPGDYYLYTYAGNEDNYLDSLGNNFTANTTKDITLPLYKVNFTTGIAGAAAYGTASGLTVFDSYGNEYYINRVYNSYDAKFGQLYSYMKKGTYSFPASTDEDTNNTIYAYNKVSEYTDSETNTKDYYLDSDNKIKQNNSEYFKLSGSFTVSGSATITLNAASFTPKASSDEE